MEDLDNLNRKELLIAYLSEPDPETQRFKSLTKYLRFLTDALATSVINAIIKTAFGMKDRPQIESIFAKEAPKKLIRFPKLGGGENVVQLKIDKQNDEGK